MPVYAMRPTTLGGKQRLATQNVDSVRHRLQVERVRARVVPAEVVNVKSRVYRGNQLLVHQPVNLNATPALIVAPTVAHARPALPHPAWAEVKERRAVEVELRPEPRVESKIRTHLEASLSGVTGRAGDTAPPLYFTTGGPP